MSLITLTRSGHTARFFAVLALLLVLGAQVLESAHYHATGEPISSCVQCHSAHGAALAAHIPGMAIFIAGAVLLFFLRARSNDTPVVTAFLPRGPPGNS
jgi:cytochrome c553